MTVSVVLLERPAEGVALIRINRPESRNSLNIEVRKLIAQYLTELGEDVATRCIVLTGNDKSFAAGADIKEMAGAGSIDMMLRGTHKLWRVIAACPKPVIAAVNGFALGGGCELALACDFAYASRNAKFGQPEVSLGVIPGFGGTQRLLRRVGKARAKEMILSGEAIDAAEAYRLGLVNAVLEPVELLPRVREVARKIGAKGPLAVAQAKRALQAGEGMPLASACELERQMFGAMFATEDQKEGMKAFLEKRPAAFKGA